MKILNLKNRRKNQVEKNYQKKKRKQGVMLVIEKDMLKMKSIEKKDQRSQKITGIIFKKIQRKNFKTSKECKKDIILK